MLHSRLTLPTSASAECQVTGGWLPNVKSVKTQFAWKRVCTYIRVDIWEKQRLQFLSLNTMSNQKQHNYMKESRMEQNIEQKTHASFKFRMPKKVAWIYRINEKHTACYNIKCAGICRGSCPLSFKALSSTFKPHDAATYMTGLWGRETSLNVDGRFILICWQIPFVVSKSLAALCRFSFSLRKWIVRLQVWKAEQYNTKGEVWVLNHNCWDLTNPIILMLHPPPKKTAATKGRTCAKVRTLSAVAPFGLPCPCPMSQGDNTINFEW